MDKPEKLPEWQAHGFTIGSARKWIQHGYQIDAANRWRDAGVFSADDAKAWQTIGISPYSVQPMLRAGMTPHDAVLWNELGYSYIEAAERHRVGQRPQPKSWWKQLFSSASDVDFALPEDEGTAMRELIRAGVSAITARRFVDVGWSGTDAIPWAKAGVDAAQALVFRLLGITPLEAQVLGDSGQSALDIVTEWWDGGIPRTEVADWLGAGFSVIETKHARANGLNVDQAAVLRSLGGQGN